MTTCLATAQHISVANLVLASPTRGGPMDDDPQELWGTEETASFLRVPKATLYQWRHRSYGPQGRRVGRYVRYDPREVRAWFAAQGEHHHSLATPR